MLTITKVDDHGGSSIIPSTGTVTPGDELTYTIVVSNTGPGTVTAASVSDPFPSELTGISYTSVAAGGATDTNPTGSGGTLTDTVTLPAGSSITYTVLTTVLASATTSLSNTATVTATNGTTTHATDLDNLTLAPMLSITKVDNRGGSSVVPSTGTVTPGSTLTYTIVVSNAGPGTETGAAVNDPFPSNLTGVSYTSVAAGGATDTNPTGSGSTLTDTVTLPSGSSITYTVHGTVASTATTSLSNTATITPVGGTGIPATDNDSLLTITKVDNRGGSSITPSTGTVTPGSTLSYTIVVSNTGPGTVSGAAVSDPFPGNLTGISYTSVAAGGATDTNPTGSGSTLTDTVTLPSGASITYTVLGTVSATATTSLSNTATVTATNGTTTQATDNDSLLTITKVDNRGGSSITPSTGTVTPGSTLSYTIVVSNTGPGTVSGAAVSDPFPGNLTGISYTSVAAGGATDTNPTGSGSTLTDTVTLPSGASITYTVLGTVSATATTSLSNTATVTATNGTTTQATDNDSLLTITKVDNRGGSSITPSTGTVTPGSTLSYTIVVSNTGPGTVSGAAVSDPFPGNLTGISYTSVAAGGATDTNPTGSGSTLTDTVTLPAGSSITYTVLGTVISTATSSLSNTATVTATNGTTTHATDNDNLLTITKVDNRGGSSIAPSTGTVTPGSTLSYTIVVSNTGPGTVSGAAVSDPFPSNLTGVSYTSVAAGGATDTNPTGSGSTLIDIVTLPSGSSITYTVTGTVAATANTALSNTATVTANNGTTTQATDNDNLLTITKVDNRGGSSITPSTGTVTPGSTLSYTIVVSNTGPGTVSGAAVSDPFPGNLTGVSYTSVATGGATDTNPTGSGSTLTDTVTLPSGASITYTVTGTVASTATTSLSNTATATATNGTTTQATDNDNLLTITKVDNRGGSSITPSTGTVTPGSTLSYTIVVSNTGPGTITGAAVSDPFPSNLTGVSYTSVAAGGATDTNPTGSGSTLIDIVTLPSGSSITYTVTGTVAATANTALSNTVTATAPNGTTTHATDADNLLTISKVDDHGGSSIIPSTGTVGPGDKLTYTIIVSNTGPGTVAGASVSDPFPTNLTSVSYTSVAAGGATDTNPTGSGSTLTDTVTLPSGASITYTVVGTVSTSATTSLSNTVTATATNGTSTSATDNDNVVPAALSGYVYVDSNNNGVKDPGEPPIAGVTVVLTGTTTGGTSVDITTTTDSLGFYSFPSLGAGNYTITETQPTNFIDGKDSVGSQNSGTIVQGPTTNAIQNITLTDGTNGINNNFGNLGLTPPFVSKQQFLYPPPPVNLAAVESLSGYAYSETTVGSPKYDPASPAAGEAALASVTITLNGPGGTKTTTTTPAGAYSFTNLQPGTYTLTETTPTGYTAETTFVGTQGSGTAGTGVISNITMLATTSGTNNDFPNLTQPIDLSITKVDNAGGSSITPSTGNVTPGQSLTYTVVVSNTGTGNATGVTIADPLPGNFTGGSWTATATGGASGFASSGTGNIEQTGVSLPAGSTITYVVTGTVSSTATGVLSNSATVTPSGGTGTTATDTDNLADLSITKVDNAGGSSITPSTGNVTPGQSLTYTIVVSNAGPGNVTEATITDPLPSSFSGASWTATATGGASGFASSGTGNIEQTGVSLPADSTITYVVTGTVTPPVGAVISSISNTATVTPPAGMAKNATDTDNLADLSITKVDSVGGSSITGSQGDFTPPGTVTYTVVVSNTGAGSVTGATIADPLPSGVSSDTWTATQAGGASGFSATGTGNIDDTDVDLPAGSSVTYVITANLSGVEIEGTVTNTATVTPPVGTPQSATDIINVFQENEVVSASSSPAASPAVAGSHPTASAATASTTLNAAAVDAALAASTGGSSSATTPSTGGSAALTDAALLSFRGSLVSGLI